MVDGFTCAVGTGGTLAGVSIGLKNKNKNIKIALSDPMGSSLYSYIKKTKSLKMKKNNFQYKNWLLFKYLFKDLLYIFELLERMWS